MEYVSLGRTSLVVSRTAFGALPIQRVADMDAAAKIIQQAYDGGVNFFDTARAYSDSETKLGYAFADIRKDVVLATKTAAKNPVKMRENLDTSLTQLQTDYIDIYQFHNPSFVPVPGSEDGLYDAVLTEKRRGKIRFIGITSHSARIAMEAINSGVYDTVQFPFSLLSCDEDCAVMKAAEEKEIGFIAMKALCGGLLTNIPAAFAWMRQYESVVPIWGVQRPEELAELLSLESSPPPLTEELLQAIEADRRDLSGSFCRGCGYCRPCPAGIPIENANRMSQLLRRSPAKNWLNSEWRAEMEKITGCTHCGLCEQRCPYHLKPYETLPLHLADYLELYNAGVSVQDM